MPTASAIIIGNELLNGKVQDANSQILAQTLFNCGVALTRIETIPDHTETIVSVLKNHAKNYNFVFTSGGIGPTHDDMTYDAISKAFNQPLELHQPTLERYLSFHQDPPNKARLKMLNLPKGAEVLYADNLWVPIVYLKPVYVLPGIPELFSHLLKSIQSRFTYQAFQREILYSAKEESDLAFNLGQVQKKYADIEIGSYPQRSQKKQKNNFRVMISIEGLDKNLVQKAAHKIKKFL